MFNNHFTTIFHRMQQSKNFDNRSIFGKDMDKTLWLTFFLGHPVYFAKENTHLDDPCIK